MAKWDLTKTHPQPSMKIFLITKTIKANSYDEVRSMVVRAENEKEARQEASLKAMDEGPETWLNSESSHCEVMNIHGDVQVLCVDATYG